MSIGKDFMIRWLLPLASALAVSGFFLFWQWPSQDGEPNARVESNTPAPNTSNSSADIVTLYSQSETTAAQAAIDDSPPAQQRFSARYVKLDASREGDNVRIELNIKKHWHINANPAGFDFLIPTEVDIVADGAPLPINLDFPAGDEINVGLGRPIRVYSGQMKLIGHLTGHGSDGPLKAQARVQACNDSGLCLPPSTLSTPLTSAAAPTSR
ncbi:MAG: protein-disulfide reductase DsbD domain-containing protein [Salinisphaera sp.]|uniref:protein-disulfide reductase DsbD domain-containing protein n=1 Tax=Salinisphaera sp. TaxID=1914330 RepID=UPI003C7BFFA6